MSRPPAALVQFLRAYDPRIGELALGLRDIVLDELRPQFESVYDAYSAVAIGYGPTERMRDQVCHIAAYADHVNLGFDRGAGLADPDGILLGNGKQVRHLKLVAFDDLERRELRALLRAARALAGAPRAKPGTLRTTVKRESVKKRRPI